MEDYGVTENLFARVQPIEGARQDGAWWAGGVLCLAAA